MKKQRAAKMAETAAAGMRAFLESQVGRTEQVLIESRSKNGMYEGYTMNYTPVLVPAGDSLIGEVVNVRIVSAEKDHCTGEMIL